MKIKRALGLFSNKYKDDSVCESCGTRFKCGVSLSGCWCMKVKLTDEQRGEIKSKFEKCLCPTCLEAVSEGAEV